MDSIIKFTPLVIGISSLVLATLVFRFNFRKDSFSKISLKPIKIKSTKNDDINIEVEKSLVNLEYINNFEIDKVNFKTREDGKISRRFKSKFDYCHYDLYHESYDWVIEVTNYGNFPSTNIELEYEVIVNKIQVDIQKEGGFKYKRVFGETIRNKVHIDYIAANDTKKIFICNLYGAFAEAFVNINKLRSSEMKFINKKTVLDSYIIPALREERTGNNLSIFFKASGLSDEKIENIIESEKENFYIHYSNSHKETEIFFSQRLSTRNFLRPKLFKKH